MKNIVKIPKYELKKLYEDREKSADEIASIYNISRSTILRRLHKYNIQIRSNYVPVPKKKLRMLYLKKRKSSREIAKIYGCQQSAILRRLKGYKISPKNIFINIPKKELKRYIKQKKSYEDIAKIYNCSVSTITRRLCKYGLKKYNPSLKKFKISKSDLIKLYHQKNWSISKIAEFYGCSYITIWQRMKEYGIKLRTLSEANRLNNDVRKIKIPKRKLNDLYIKQKIPVTKIAKKYNCNHKTILRRMKGYGIKSRDLTEAMVIYPKKDFSNNLLEKAYIIGFRLGDLHVTRTSKNGKTIKIECSSPVTEQIELFRNLFQKYGHINTYPVLGPSGEKEVRIYSLLNESFSFLFKKEDMIDKWILDDEKSFFAFLAGYIDAEGYISTNPLQCTLLVSSYDKNILHQIWTKLSLMGIKCPKPRISAKKGYKSKAKTVPYNKDYWSLGVYSKKILLVLFNKLLPYLKHQKKKNSILIAMKNINWRNKNFGNLRMEDENAIL